MARILYGVMGNTFGHVMRTQAIVSRMPGHSFHFVGGGRVPGALGSRYPVLEVPVLRTVHRKQRVSVALTVAQIARRVSEAPAMLRKIEDLIEEWQPDMIINDREFFLPLAAKRMNVPILSIDHSHVLKACRYPVPADQKLSWSLAMLNDYLFFDFTRRNLVVSFFHPPLRPGMTDELLPPVLRTAVEGVVPSEGDTIFVYQTSPTFGPLINALRNQPRPAVVYGFRKEGSVEGNITFKPYHAERMLEDLAASAYVIVNGGHNVICEALHFGKPVLCFPIAMLFEQFINAWHVRALNYGDFSTTSNPDPEIFKRFEANLPGYKASVRSGHFNGTARVVARVEEFIAKCLKTGTP